MKRILLLLSTVGLGVLVAGAMGLLAAPTVATAAKPKPLYPNLKTLKPKDLLFDTIRRQGTRYHVLRFTNTVWNAGEGPLEVRADPRGAGRGDAKVSQRVYDAKGDYTTTKPVGTFVYHPGHGHMHFGDFAEYQLWTRADYDEWASNGRDRAEERYEKKGSKNGVCMMDTGKVKNLPNSPLRKVYKRGCGPNLQGISVGWGDTYDYILKDQWVVLGKKPLVDGNYVLRAVADPKDLLYESPGKRRAWRESRIKNAAVTYFTVEEGVIEATPL